jgi:hypothetical protein
VTRSGVRRFGAAISFGDSIFKSRAALLVVSEHHPRRKSACANAVRKMHSFIGFADETIGDTLPKPLDCTK